MIAEVISTFSLKVLLQSYVFPLGLQAANITQLLFILAFIPALLTLNDCYSINSCKADKSLYWTLVNSSILHKPLFDTNKLPATIYYLPFSFIILAVKPAIDAVVALLYVLCGNNEAAYDNKVVLPVAGLPTINVWILCLALFSYLSLI